MALWRRETTMEGGGEEKRERARRR